MEAAMARRPTLPLLLLLLLLAAVAAPAASQAGAGDAAAGGMRRWLDDLNATAAPAPAPSTAAGGGGGSPSSMSFISYRAMTADSAPCSVRGASYYNCQPGAEANPYSRGCSAIARCRG